jgi:hypothetical protein
VTLNEAYQFAFNETLGQTTETQAGAQHPAYDINLTGTGEVVMTDLRQTSSTLVLDEGLGGRFYVRNAEDQLVVELYKPHGRSIELGLEPGKYEVRCEVESGVLVSAAALEEGGNVTLHAKDFVTTDAQPVTVRGGAPVGGPPTISSSAGLDRRHRIRLSFGIWNHSGSRGLPASFSSVYGPSGSLGYAYWFRENLAFTLNFNGHAVSVESGPYDNATAIASSLFGIRYYPLAPMQVRPYVSIATGPVFVASAGSGSASTVTTAIGGQIGRGLDAQINRSFMIGAGLGYNFTSIFPDPSGYEEFQRMGGRHRARLDLPGKDGLRVRAERRRSLQARECSRGGDPLSSAIALTVLPSYPGCGEHVCLRLQAGYRLIDTLV